MTIFLLIRHAAHDLLGRVLVGRAPDVNLNARGRLDAQQLVERLEGRSLAAVYSSPLERARETAQPLAERRAVEVRIDPAFNEINFGDWTSATFADLNARPDWRHWNDCRGSAEPPGGENMAQVQLRMATRLSQLEQEWPDQTLAIVSHGDVIKAALLHYLSIPLDLFHRVEISPSSVSVVALDEGEPQILAVNSGAGF